MVDIRPIRSYQRSVWAVSPVKATTSLMVYRSWPSGRGWRRGGAAQKSVLVAFGWTSPAVVCITVMAPTL
ncbi:hypothetical protein GCM10010216_01810 [Streptomyces flaveolus]|nr:hypothetical protein GCM10010216_01810 [Streptomyces flaveolus]